MIYAFAGYRLDLARAALVRDGVPVPVEPQVFDLIRLLAEARGALVSRDRIFEVVWQGRIVSDAALSSRVKAARQALGDSGRAQRMIETRHGRGFRLVPEVRIEGEPPAAGPERPAAGPAASPAVPVIAVMPFDAFSADPEAAILADGLTEELVTGLARFRLFRVISRNSVFAWKGRERDIRAFGAALGADYVLEGSVMRAGGRLRLHAQLIEVATDHHVWADRVEAAETDLFAMFDTLCARIVGSLQPELLAAEIDRAVRVTPSQQSAWQKWVQAQAMMMTPSRRENAAARALLTEAAALEPGSPRLHSALAVTHLWDTLFYWTDDPEASTRAALQALAQAGARGGQDAWTLAAMGGCRLVLKDHAGALGLLARAVEADPNSSLARGTQALALAYDGQAAAALAAADEADRLSPADRRAALWVNARGLSGVQIGDFALVLSSGRRIAEMHPDYPAGQRLIAAGAARLGLRDEATRAVDRIKTLLPHYRVSAAIAALPFRLPDHAEAYAAALRDAGLPA